MNLKTGELSSKNTILTTNRKLTTNELEHIKETDFEAEWENTMEKMLPKIIEQDIEVKNFSGYGCFQKFWLFIRGNYYLVKELEDERKVVFSLSKILINPQNQEHKTVISRVIEYLGWEDEQAQDQDFEKICRHEAGYFGLLQIFWITEIHSSVLLKYCKGVPQLEKKLLIILLEISLNCLETLKLGKLTQFCNLQRSVIDVLNKFFYQTLYLIIFQWLTTKNRKKQDLFQFMKEWKDYARNNTEEVIDIDPLII